MKTKILIIGDVMLDNYVFGKAKIISPEAPVPILQVSKKTTKLGGAANVAQNCKSLGMDVTLLGGIGKDENGKILKKLAHTKKIKSIFIQDKNYKTITKTRYLGDYKQMLRVDEENYEFSNDKIHQIKKIIKKYDNIIISDYAKGFIESLGKNFIQKYLKTKKLFVDPKGLDFSKYKGSFLIKPNLKEFELATSFERKTSEKQTALSSCKKYKFKYLLLTKGHEGMNLYDSKFSRKTHFVSKNREVTDVTGAGDTVLSTLVYFYTSGLSLKKSISLSNKAAGISVSKIGNFHVDKFKLLNDKVLNINQLKKIILEKKKNKNKIVFTNGVFDIFHAGHADMINKAKEMGDILIVGINNDASVKMNKGNTRPINSLKQRIEVISSIQSVDYIVTFNKKNPFDLIKLIKPDILVKGDDYKKSEIIGGEFVKKFGGKVKIIKFKFNISSTKIIKRYG